MTHAHVPEKNARKGRGLGCYDNPRPAKAEEAWRHGRRGGDRDTGGRSSEQQKKVDVLYVGEDSHKCETV